MKTDYKAGDWIEVLYDSPVTPEIKKGDKFQIICVNIDCAEVFAYNRSCVGWMPFNNIMLTRPLEENNNPILSKAESIISGQRQTVNGKPERSFEQIAARWSLTVGTKITARQVALMMVDMKMVRALQGVTTEGHDDHFVDMAGYVALAAELGEK